MINLFVFALLLIGAQPSAGQLVGTINSKFININPTLNPQLDNNIVAKFGSLKVPGIIINPDWLSECAVCGFFAQ